MNDLEVALLNDRSFNIVPFSDADLASLENLLDKDMDPELFCRENPMDIARLQTFIKTEIKFYRDVYLSGAHGDRGYATNALTFYYAFISGLFLDSSIDSIIVVADDWYRVILFDARELGSEVDILHHLDQFPGNSFVMRGSGFMNYSYQVEIGAMRKFGRQMARKAILVVDELEGIQADRFIATHSHC